MADTGGTTSNTTTGAEGALSRQPAVFDYSQINQFKVYLPLFPITEWFVTRANIPGVSLGQAVQATPFTDMPVVGDKLTYDDFYFTFIVDEQLKNYQEMHNWLVNIGFPASGSQFKGQARPDGTSRASQQIIDQSTPGRVVDMVDRTLYSDIEMFILSSKNNPVVKIQMFESFPTSLTAIEYSSGEGDTSYAECTCTFAYSYFTIEALT